MRLVTHPPKKTTFATFSISPRMHLQKLSVVNYKNLREASLEFSEGLNLFLGDNGQGKTNLLDAIYYLSFCKSHSNPIDSQNIHHDADFFLLQGRYLDEEKNCDDYSCGIKRRQKKVFQHNKKNYEKLSDHIGRIPLVLVSPADEDLIRDGSEERRRFMDMTISQYDRRYMQLLVKYNEALQQRNALLRKEELSHFDDTIYDIYEMQMAECADFIYQQRACFIESFVPVFNRYYHEIAGQRETVSLHYLSQLKEASLESLLKASRQRDKLLGFTTKGIHKDDLEMNMDGYPIKRVGSQGQTKTYLIAMKLAQLDFLQQVGNFRPILLLDDLFDKLDRHRLERILSIVSNPPFGQVFITDTQHNGIERYVPLQSSDCKSFCIVAGTVSDFPTP